MSANLQEWNWEPLIDAELEKWFLFKDESSEKKINDTSLTSNQFETSNGSSSNFEDAETDKNLFEEFPLFEEIEPLEETKYQSYEEFQFLETHSNGGEKFSFDQNGGIASDFYVHPFAVENILASSMENATFVFSDDKNETLYIQSDPNSNYHLIGEKNLEADRRNPNSRETEKSFSFEIIQSDSFVPSPAGTAGKMQFSNGSGEKFENPAAESDQWESDTSSSSSTATREEESDDPEWKPRKKSAGNSKASAKRGSHLDEKRLRKKEQNKTAATRYRLKKKAEMEELLREERDLKRKRENLKEEMADVRNKVKCMKELMRELFKSEGYIT